MADRLDAIGRDVKVSFAYQDDPRGLGHAVGCARRAVGDEPFAVLLPDEIMGSSELLGQMARLCETSGGSVVGLKEVRHDEVGRYGVIDPIGQVDDDGVVAIRSMIEKPDPTDAPSDLIIIGRYVLTPDVFDEIDRVVPGAGGEIQLTDALRAQAARSPFHGVVRDVLRYDTGNPFGWLTAVIEIALADRVMGAQLRPWLRTLLARTPEG
jgi:UTP--glucose-1-phosphate uridylyltransferase